MTPEEAIKNLKTYRSLIYDRIEEEIALAITALTLINTVDEAKYRAEDGYLFNDYKQGWNDALEAIKVRLLDGEDWSDMNEND